MVLLAMFSATSFQMLSHNDSIAHTASFIEKKYLKQLSGEKKTNWHI
jgi:hypothetical protein